MATKEQAVRDAAGALKSAIAEATAAGYRVAWPANADGLDSIAVSATAATVEEPAPVPPRRGFVTQQATRGAD
jgi:hypothetical protein